VAGIIRSHKLSPNSSLRYNALDGGFQVLLDQCNGQCGSGGHVATGDLPRPRDSKQAASSPVTAVVDTFWLLYGVYKYVGV